MKRGVSDGSRGMRCLHMKFLKKYQCDFITSLTRYESSRLRVSMKDN